MVIELPDSKFERRGAGRLGSVIAGQVREIRVMKSAVAYGLTVGWSSWGRGKGWWRPATGRRRRLSSDDGRVRAEAC